MKKQKYKIERRGWVKTREKKRLRNNSKIEN